MKLITALTAGFVVAIGASPGRAADFPLCPPPAASEYLLLVRGETEAERTRVQALLPSNSTVMVCSYLDDTVVRAGGFTSLETASAWAQYMTEVEQLQAFVARPATLEPGTTAQPVATEDPVQTAAAPAAPTLSFNPQDLGAGYAILVPFQDQPAVALAVQERVGQAVGLAVYRQQAYLLIAQSPNVEGAASTLRVLGNRNISGFIVDSREVVMLVPAIATAP